MVLTNIVLWLARHVVSVSGGSGCVHAVARAHAHTGTEARR
jgi:hypothetical protein